MIGRVIGSKYHVLQEIGSGTISTVYLAMNLTTNEVVALKVMHAELTEEGQSFARFQREAKLLVARQPVDRLRPSARLQQQRA